MQRWFADFQRACAQSESILKGKKRGRDSGDQLFAADAGELDRVRTYAASSPDDNHSVASEFLQHQQQMMLREAMAMKVQLPAEVSAFLPLWSRAKYNGISLCADIIIAAAPIHLHC